MNNLDKQLKRIGKIGDEVRNSVEYKVESAKIDYSEQISKRLEALGLTKTELAKRMGVSAPYVTKLLRGTANLTLDSMVNIADALECDFISEVRPRKRATNTGRSSAPPRGPTVRKSALAKTKQRRPAMVREAPSSYGKKRKNTL